MELHRKFFRGGEIKGPAMKPFSTQLAIESVTSSPYFTATFELGTWHGPSCLMVLTEAPFLRKSTALKPRESSDARSLSFKSVNLFSSLSGSALEETLSGRGLVGNLSQKAPSCNTPYSCRVGISGNFLGFLLGWETSTGSYTERVVSQPRILFQSSGKPRNTRPAEEAEKWVGGEKVEHSGLKRCCLQFYPFHVSLFLLLLFSSFRSLVERTK
jgi:hypothetical protein